MTHIATINYISYTNASGEIITDVRAIGNGLMNGTLVAEVVFSTTVEGKTYAKLDAAIKEAQSLQMAVDARADGLAEDVVIVQ